MKLTKKEKTKCFTKYAAKYNYYVPLVRYNTKLSHSALVEFGAKVVMLRGGAVSSENN
jgi:hypothetical protein